MRRIAFFCAVILVLGAICPIKINLSEDNSWTTFMGNNEHSYIVPASAGPKTDQIEVHWAYECGFRVLPSIIIANNLAFCGSQDNNLHAVHLDTALEAWRYNCGDKCNKDKHITSDSLKEGGVNSTPVYSDGKLYFGIICYKLVCIDATNGSKVWEYDDPDNDEHFDSPVLLYKDKIYATSFERLYCLDAKTGKKLWITAVWNNKMSPPMIADGKLYIAALTSLMCLNPDTGEPAVKDGFVHDGKTINFACPTYKDGKVYFGTDDSDFFCFDAKTGKEVWRARDQRAITCPVVTDDKVFYGDIFNGITCLDRNTGKDLWKFKTDGLVAGAPVLCGEKLYFGSADGCMYCIETKFGHQIWKYDSHEGMKANTGDHFFMSSPVIVGGKIYIGNVDGRVFCFGDVRKGLILDKVKVSVPAKYVLTNEKIKLTATAYAKDGSVMQSKPVWSCEPKELGTIDQDGVFWAGAKSGTVTVRATVDKIYDQVRVDIKDIKDLVVNVSVEPKSLKLYTNQQQQIKATAFDGAGNVIEGVNFEWRVEPTTIGTIENGLFTALKSGKGKVTAVIGSRSAVTQVLVVKPTRIAIDPQTAIVTAGGTQQFKVTVWDDLDDKIENPVPTWSVEPQTLGTINADGLFVAGARAGEGRIVANFEGLEAISPVTITPPPSGRIEVSPSALDFGTLDFDTSKTMKVTLSNSGNAAVTAEITSDADWLKVSPTKADIGPSANQVLDVKADVTGKTPGTQLSGKVLVKWDGGSAEVSAKVKVAQPKDCVTADVKNIVADVSFNGTGSYSLELRTAPGKDLTVTIESSNPRVSPGPASIKINGSTEKIRLNIDTSGVNVGEKIDGTLTISAGEFYKTLEIPFSFTVKKAEIVILLQIGNKTAKIDGKETTLSVPPQIISGNTMVPLRFIGEAFGCKVDWNGNEKKITITRGSFEMMLWLGKTTAKVNGQDKVMKAPPASINGSTLVPLRFIAEAFGATVNFNSATQEITINWAPNN